MKGNTMKEHIENRKKWVAALRSGQYKQCQYTLYNGEGFCCLGVATDTYLKERGLEWESPDGMWHSFEGESELLPKKVAKWLGIPVCEGYKYTDVLYTMNDGTRQSVAILNDDSNYSFNDIANVIEEQYIKPFEGEENE